MCLALGHNTVTLVRLEPAAFQSRSSTLPLSHCAPFCANRGNRSKFLNYDVFLALEIVFILANSAEPDEMPPYAAFYLGLQVLPKYLLYTR